MERIFSAADLSVRYSYCEVGEKADRTPLLVTRSKIMPNTGWPEANMTSIWKYGLPNLPEGLDPAIELCGKEYSEACFSENSTLTFLCSPWAYVCTAIYPAGPTGNENRRIRSVTTNKLDAIMAALGRPIVSDTGAIGDSMGARKLGILDSSDLEWNLDCCHGAFGHPTPSDILRAFRTATAHYGGRSMPARYQFVGKLIGDARLNRYLPVLVGGSSNSVPTGIKCYPIFEAADTEISPCASLVQSDSYNVPVGVLYTVRGIPDDPGDQARLIDYIWDTARTGDYRPVNEFDPNGELELYFGITGQDLLYSDVDHINELVLTAYATKYHSNPADTPCFMY